MRAPAGVILVPLAITAGYFGVAYFLLPGLFPPFYFADFNKARDRIAGIPGVKIIDHWQHHDLTLEDCGFTLRVNDSEPVRVDFHDGDDWSLPFRRVDGVIVSYPYNPETNDYEEVSFTARQLSDLGVDATNLSSVLQDIGELLDTATAVAVARDTHPKPGVWVRIYRDLSRYERYEHVAGQRATLSELNSEGEKEPEPEAEGLSR